MNTITSLIKRFTSRMRSGSARTGSRETTAAESPRDFTLERETSRVGNLSEEDQAWEAASRKRNRDAQERNQTPPEMADQRTPDEQAGMSDAEQERFPDLTKRQLDRRLWVRGTALVVLIIVIIVMAVRS